jgi:hypothetical protein
MKILEEAVEDARQIQDAATRIAQERLVEALNPRLKQMIEARLMNEQDIDIEEMFDDLESEDELDARMSFDDEPEFDTSDDVETVSMSLDDEPEFDTSDDVETVSMSLDDEGAPVVTTSAGQDQDNPPYVQIDAAGDVNVELEFDDDDDDDEKEVITGAEVLEMKSAFKHVIKASNALYQRSNRRLSLKEAKKIAKSARSLKSSVTNYASKGILTNDPAFMQSLQEAFVTLSKTQNNLELFMKRRTNRLLEEKDMEEMDMEEMDMEELDELDAVLALTPEDDEEADMLGDLDFDDLDIMVDVGDDDEDMDMDDMDMDMEDEDTEDEDMDMEDMDMDDDDEEVEIDESTLRAAISEMRRARRRSGRRLSEDAVDAAPSYGGGVAGDEMFIDVDEDTLINVLADELGRVERVGTAAPAVVESRRRRRQRAMALSTNRARTRALSESRRNRAKLVEMSNENRKLKQQLNEMNLFSAKLLYVNKIFNGNKNVTAKQRRAIVEAMDNAKTLREAKLLYRSLKESLTSSRTRKAKKSLSENRVRVLGSASRSTPSAQPAQNGVEVDRWATLAGIDEKK